jgi:hypothetical protein
MDLAAETYRLAKLMPRSEEYRLTSQLLRAAASIAANIAEGNARNAPRLCTVRQHRARLLGGDRNPPPAGCKNGLAA